MAVGMARKMEISPRMASLDQPDGCVVVEVSWIIVAGGEVLVDVLYLGQV